ncbi:MAG TPA: gamma-glutamyl-gamma-aminobutyrate hydrolase family protein [Candidatus Limnocylindrales bacterium]|nr:gamma-glutamyl-gamma-aminobutyrate hydrolase family protein [Candidatus Limnocylindrales bacterium]
MKPRIAIPEPCSYDSEYSGRALPPYLRAIEAAGGEPVVIPLQSTPEEIARLITSCAAILLPGSKADVDPQKFNAEAHPKTAPPDPPRDAADELLLQDAYNLHKPVFGICYGLQSLNVWRTGSLIQDIESKVNHSAGAKVEVAHQVTVAADSLLAKEMLNGKDSVLVPVNSSHHQSADVVGDGLRAVAHCAEDGVIEAIEGTVPGHYVLAVQWHPERTFDSDSFSNNLFQAFINSAREWNELNS